MTKSKLFAAAAGMLSLGGCGAMTFAPPEVSLSRRTPERSVSEQCLLPANSGDELRQDVNGALQLVGNFIDAYRCAMRQAADGRQAFQLPGFLALAGSAAATALGGSPRWTIAGGAASAMFGAGNSYYDSTTQTLVLSDALEALDCVQTAAVGVEAFARLPRTQNAEPNARLSAARQTVDAAERRAADARDGAERAEVAVTASANAASGARSAMTVAASTDPRAEQLAREDSEARVEALAASESFRLARAEVIDANREVALARRELADATRAAASLGDVEITSEQQYFHMIAAALLDVEVAAAQRLARRGTPFDGEAVATRIATLAEEANKAHERANSDPEPPRSLVNALGADRAATVTRVQLHLDELRPRLQQCILRAQV